jgi:glycosyltransferase involved in cell wall biosynthesis
MRVNCEKWKTHCNQCPLSQAYPKSFIDRSYLNFEDKKEAFIGHPNLTIITPSFWLKEIVQKSFLKEYSIEVIHNGIDLEIFHPKEQNTKQKIVLGVASTWGDQKGLLDFKKLRDKLPLEVEIVLIGLSESQIKGLPKGIIGIRRTENVVELAEWYSKASVFVNPTYVDNFPTTNIEALACGTPVITYNTGGSPEAINPETGVVVDKGDVAGIVQAIRNLEAKDQIELSSKCVDRAKLLYDKEHRYLDYLKIFENMIK